MHLEVYGSEMTAFLRFVFKYSAKRENRVSERGANLITVKSLWIWGLCCAILFCMCLNFIQLSNLKIKNNIFLFLELLINPESQKFSLAFLLHLRTSPTYFWVALISPQNLALNLLPTSKPQMYVYFPPRAIWSILG